MKFKKSLAVIALCASALASFALPRYASYSGGSIADAPTLLHPNPAPPTEAEYNAHGFYRVVDEVPQSPAPEGFHYEPSGWELADGVIRRVYEAVQDPPPPPRTFSKYKMVAALMAANLWDGVKAWIEGQDGAYDLYLAAEDISEDEPLLAQGIAALKAELGITDEQVEAILAASVKEGL